MVTFILRRLVYMVITLIVVSILSFLLVTLPPGSALDGEISRLRAMGGNLPQQQINDLMVRYGVNDPVYEQYVKWVTGVLQGDFGESFTFHAQVNDLIGSRIGFSVMLALMALIFAWVVAIPIGVYSATHRYTAIDNIVSTIQFLGLAIPEFLLALLILVFAANVLDFDVGGLFSAQYLNAPWSMDKFVDMLKHIWIPVIVIGAGSTTWLTRVMRANLLDVLNSQYIQTARAKGVAERRVIWKHAVRNAINPLIMALGTSLPVLVSGEAIVAIVLALPTMGPLLVQALQNQDMYLAVTLLMFSSLLLIVGNLLADLLLAWVDPRARNLD